MPEPVADNLVRFVRFLRMKGMRVPPSTGVDLMSVANAVGWTRRSDIKAGFQSVVVTRPEQLAVFEEAFNEFFFGWATEDLPDTEPEVTQAVPVISGEPEQVDMSEIDDLAEGGASLAERLARRDFADLTPAELDEVRQMIAAMRWTPATATSRRWVAAASGSRPDMRRTLRSAVGPRADLMELARKDPKPRRRPLVILADVSGSMERYVEMLLHFAHAVPARAGRVETFVFSTRLTRISHELRRRDPSEALELVSRAVHDWSGGTRIGDAIGTFNRDWSRRVGHGGPIGIIVSDGWDRGEPELLDAEMARFSRSVHRTVWLNPLAGRENYQPETRGMQAAWPHIDDFLPAGRLTELRDVVRLLESMATVPQPRQRAS